MGPYNKFDQGLTFMLSDLDFSFESWNRFDLSFGTSVQNLDSFQMG